MPGEKRADARFSAVYVNDSFEAADAIARARKLADQGRWTEAAEKLQRTSDTLGDNVVRVATGCYVGIRRHISEIIAGWPRAGLAAYRSLFEREIHERAGRAENLTQTLARPTDLQPALRLFERYFCTVAAAELADRIGQLAIESGDLALAEHVYRRVLEHHPDKAAYASRYQAMLTIVLAMQGERATGPSAPVLDVEVRWMGRVRPVREVIAAIGSGFAELRAPASPSAWPIFGGDPERNRRGSAETGELGLLWRFDGFQPPDSGGREGEADGEERDRGRYLSINPVVADGLVLAQQAREIVALRRNTGAVAWRFRADTAAEGAYSYLDEQPLGWNSVTIRAGRAYASLPGETLPYYSYESARTPPELLCLDVSTGRLIWRVKQEAIEEAFAEVTFDSSPIVRHGRLYVVGRRRRSFGFEDCYLYRFNAANGTLEQRTHLGSASTGTFGSRQTTEAIAAAHADTIYVCTNLGSVAAVGARSGAVRWLRLYERDRVEATGDVRFPREDKPWRINPVILSDGRVVVLPTDAARVLVLDSKDGSLLLSIPTSRLGEMETLLGVRGDLLCGTGRAVTCYDLSAGTVRWSTPLPEGSVVYGRGFWADGRLLIPTRNQLLAFDITDGRRSQITWDTEGRGGNLLAMPDQLLVAGAGRVSAYIRKTQIWQVLRARMAAAPSDPLPALELAEIALSNGEYSEAVDVLTEAARRADNLDEPPEADIVRRLFGDVLMFVDRLAAHSNLETDLLETLFRCAAKYAPDASSHLRYRFRFAELFEERGQYARAVRIYQQILRDRSLRELPVDGGAKSGQTAGSQAQESIAKLIAEQGRAVYAPYEAEAKTWFIIARADCDISGFQRIADTFPNSEAAPRALVAQGELLAGLGRPLQAARCFARAYHRYPKQVDRPAMLRKIADAYENAGKAEHAYLWLTKAAREHPGVRFEHEGRSVTFLQYRKRLAHVRDRVEPSLPDLAPPLRNSYEKDFGQTVTLLAPWFGNEPASDWSRYFVYTPEGIRAYAARDGTELWPKPSPVRTNAELLIAASDVAVFATSYEVFALDVSTGARRWSHGEYPEHLDQPEGDWEDGEMFRAHALHDRRLVSVRDNGQMTCVLIDTGRKLWSQTHRPVPDGRLRLTDPWVVYHVTQDDRVIVCLIDAGGGEWSDAITTGESGAVEDLFVTLDGGIVLAASRSIVLLDPETRQRRWRVPLRGHLRRSSLVLDVDALYFSDDGRSITKIGIEDGQPLWESQELARAGDDDLLVRRQGSSLILTNSSSVSAVDAVTGLTLWQGTTPKRPRFVARLLTDAYVIAVDVRGGLLESEGLAYFYDHRNASGIIAREGGAARLGRLGDVRTVMAADGTLLIQTGPTIKAWTQR